MSAQAASHNVLTVTLMLFRAEGTGRVRLRAGTLYTALDRLRADGLIEVDREEIVEGRLRRYYRLTTEGTRRLAAEAARLQANATAALTRLNPLGVVT